MRGMHVADQGFQDQACRMRCATREQKDMLKRDPGLVNRTISELDA